MSSKREFKSGLAGGVIIGALATLGLMKISKTVISSGKQIIPSQPLKAGEKATLLPPVTHKFAVILFHGDGDHQVKLTILVDNKSYILYGDEQAIELLTGESIAITAENTDTTSPRNTSTIEIAYITW